MKEDIKYIAKLTVLEDVTKLIKSGKEFYIGKSEPAYYGNSDYKPAVLLTDSIDSAYEFENLEEFDDIVIDKEITEYNAWLIGRKYIVDIIKKTTSVTYEKIDIEWKGDDN